MHTDHSLIDEVAADLTLAGANIETAVVSAFELVDVCRRNTICQSSSLEVFVGLAAKFLKSGSSVHDAVIAAVQLQYMVRREGIDREARGIAVENKRRFETLFNVAWNEYAPYEKALREIMRQPHQRRNVKLKILEARFAKQMAKLYPELDRESQLWFWREQNGISCFEFTYFRNLIEKRILETRRKGGQTQISRLSARQNEKIS